MGFLEFGQAMQGAFVHEFEVGADITFGVALGAGLDPGVETLFGPFAGDVLGNAGDGGVVGPAYLSHDVVGVFAFILEVAAGTGGGGLPAFGVGVLQGDFPVPFVAHDGHDLAVLAHGVGFPVVVVYAAVAGGARFGMAGFGRGEFVPGVAHVAFVLVGVAHAAAFGDLALGHGGKYGNFDVGFPVKRVRGASLRPWDGLVWPDQGVALGFAFGKFLQVAGAADVCRGHAQVFHVVGFAFGVDVDVAVDAANFFELFVGAEPVHGAQVLLDVFQFGFFVVNRIVRFQVADLVQVGVGALFPGIHPDRRFVGVAFDAFVTCGHFFHGGGRFVEGGRVKVHAHGDGLPVFGQGAASGTLRRVFVALDQRLVQFFR